MSVTHCQQCLLKRLLPLGNCAGKIQRLIFRNTLKKSWRSYSKTALNPVISEAKQQQQKQPFITDKHGHDLCFLTLKSRVTLIANRIRGEEIDFSLTETGQVVVYTDGSCLFNNTTDTSLRKSGIGVFWGRDDHPLNVSMPHGGRKLTNNRAEIAAAHAAIIIAKGLKIERLRIYTDSKTLVKACKYWLPVWEQNDWRLKSSDKSVSNQDMWKKLSEDLLHVLVDFQHLTDKNEGIKKAHKLAQLGANSTPPMLS